MRKVKIEINNLKDEKGLVCCPLQNHPETDGICHPNCAWFRIDQWPKNKVAKQQEVKNFAYCGDKIIGEIVEAKDE